MGWLVSIGGLLLLAALVVVLRLRRVSASCGPHLTETRLALETAYEVIEANRVVLFRWQLALGWPVDFVSGNVARWGYTPEEFLSGERRFADIIHPGDLDRVKIEVEERLAAGATAYRQEYRILHADGSPGCSVMTTGAWVDSWAWSPTSPSSARAIAASARRPRCWKTRSRA